MNDVPESSTRGGGTAFVWNAGGWFGAQFGSTLWVLLLGGVLIGRDAVAGGVCVVSFLALNAWGLHLWRSRGRLSAYVGIQRFVLAVGIVVTVVVWVVNARGLSESPTTGGGVSTWLPPWGILIAPVLMVSFHLRERSARVSHRAEG